MTGGTPILGNPHLDATCWVDGGVAWSGAPSWWSRQCSSWMSLDVYMILCAKYAFCCGGNDIFKTIYRSVLIATFCFYVCSYSILSLTQLHFFKKNDVENSPCRGSRFSFVVNFGRSESSKLYPSWMSLDVYMVLCDKICFSLQGVASRACCTFQEKLQSVASRAYRETT